MNQKWIYSLGLLLFALIAFFFYNKYALAPVVDFNKIRLVDLDDRPVKFETFDGKKKVVCFSASWCPNCLNELREINLIKSDQLDDVEIIVISDESLEEIRSFSKNTQYPFTFLKLEQSFNQIGINSIPTSYILNGSQQVKKETVGYIDWTDPSTCAHLKSLMN